eukprot:jgi/Undpi1/7094/HiC_scaffold_22.g09568.m1
MENIGDLLTFLGQCARRTMVVWDIIRRAVGKWAKLSANAIIKLVKQYLQCKKSYQEYSEFIGAVVGDGSIGNVPIIAAGNVPHVSADIPIVQFDGGSAQKEEEKSQEDTSTMSEKASNAEEEKQENENGGGLKEAEERERKAKEDKAALEKFFADKKRRRQQRKSRTGVQRGTRTTCHKHGA